SEHELNRRLSDRSACAVGQERELFELLEPFGEPFARPVAAMIARRESRFESVPSFQQPGRMRHAHEHAHAVVFSNRDKAAVRVLLEHVVDDLESRDLTLPYQRQPFSLPAVSRAERGAVAADLTVRL